MTRRFLIFAWFLLAAVALCQISGRVIVSGKVSVGGHGRQFTVVATAKGPNQINLTWGSAPDAGYGYIVEIQSAGDSRYSSFTQYRGLPNASGYTCDPTVSFFGTTGCAISDAGGAHVYNPVVPGVPSWVTESQYVDPQDGTAAQAIIYGLKNNTSYSFRVRIYTGNTSPTYGAYSNTASVTTSNYTVRYVSTTGSDGNDGTAPDDAHAWKTIFHGSVSIGCGWVVYILGGSYPLDRAFMNGSCTSTSKMILQVNPGDTAVIPSEDPSLINSGNVLTFFGTNNVIDGLTVSCVTPNNTDYDAHIAGANNALLGVNFGPNPVPGRYGGVEIFGPYTLIYGSYLHDYGSPDGNQNPSGNGGFVIHVGTNHVVIWNNHLTRGGHDSTFCSPGCANSKMLNNIYDGGWGMAFEVEFDGANSNLFEGAIGLDAGYLESGIYKPALEISNGFNTVRRGTFVVTMAGYTGLVSRMLEVSAFGSAASNNSNLVYNNVFYGGLRGYFQSHNLGITAYDGVLVQNNIFSQFTGDATEIYLQNLTPNAIAYNDFYPASGNVNQAMFVWGQDSGPPFENPQTLTYAEANYGPAVVHNLAVSGDPLFVSPGNMDFHLGAGSIAIGSGAVVADPTWGFNFQSGVDLGAFGLKSR